MAWQFYACIWEAKERNRHLKTEISSYIPLRKKSYIIDFNFYFTKNKTRLENGLLEICDIIVTTLLNINIRLFVLCFFLISKVVDLNIDILKADKDNSFPFKSRVKHYLMKHFIVIFCNERRSTNVIITWIWT